MEDIQPICRACLKECEEYKSLHKQGIICGALSTLGSLLSFVTNISIEPDDGLPANICNRCVKSLAKAYIFKKTVVEGNDTLRSQLAEVGADGSTNKNETEENYAVAYKTELDGLAAAAQIKEALDRREYLTVSVLGEMSCDEGEMDIEITDSEDLASGDVVIEEVYQEQHEDYVEEEHLKLEDGSPDDIYEVVVQDADNEQTISTAISEEVEGEEFSYAEQNSPTFSDYVNAGQIVLKPNTTKRHKKQKPFVAELQCKECGKQLSNQNSFKYHMQLHSDATPFLCSLCGQGFKTRNAYDGHVILHNPNNPNTCKICNKSYRQPSSLRTHMLSHTGERPFQCDICGKGMTQKSGYKKHMLIHTGEKPHNCDVCGREFRYSSNLIAHKRCHTGERPYPCPSCEKCFPTSEQMKRHLQVHSVDRKFICQICNKSFKRQTSLMGHMSLHEHADIEENSKKVHESADKLSKSKVVELY